MFFLQIIISFFCFADNLSADLNLEQKLTLVLYKILGEKRQFNLNNIRLKLTFLALLYANLIIDKSLA